MPVRKSLKHIPSSPVKINPEEEAPMKQGIVAILGSDCERSKAGSIRRTLSADMSSKKWLEQNGFLSAMKKNVSSEALALPPTDSSSSSESEEEFEENPNQDEVWRSIQAQKESDRMQKPAQIQVWGSILTQKSENSVLPPPYVHPLVKKSSVSALSEKSLEVCTESLGSETGSDCFSSRSSEIGDEDREERQVIVAEEFKDSIPFPDLHVAKYKKSPVQPFPPPLPSIAGDDGAALHMHSHRENGRLVLEAVSVPPRNYFHAQRQEGRLVLTLIHAPATPSTETEAEFEKDCEIMDEEYAREEEDDVDDDMEEEQEKSVEKESEFVMEQNLSLPSGMIRVHKSGLVMKKLMAVGNINPKWSKNIDKVGDTATAEAEVAISKSLPPRPAPTGLMAQPAAASYNVYEYFWRNKAAASGGCINPMSNNKNINGGKVCDNQDLMVMRRNKTEQFVRGCKEARKTRRTLSIWEPYCIATS